MLFNFTNNSVLFTCDKNFNSKLVNKKQKLVQLTATGKLVSIKSLIKSSKINFYKRAEKSLFDVAVLFETENISTLIVERKIRFYTHNPYAREFISEWKMVKGNRKMKSFLLFVAFEMLPNIPLKR